MTASPSRYRFLLGVCSAILVGVAAVLVLGVIPGVRVATVPDISPERAIPAFWVAAGVQLLSAAILALTAMITKNRNKLSTGVVVGTGVVTMLLGFVLSDAVVAFLEAGASMRTVAVLLIVCVVGDLVVGVLATITALRR